MGHASATPGGGGWPSSTRMGVPFAQLADGAVVEMQADLFSDRGYSPSLARWPRSGICLRGLFYARPAWEPRMSVTGCSSSDLTPLPVLLTPTSNLAINGGSQPMAKRKAGGHGPTLCDQLERDIPVLPTPVATDAHGARNATCSRQEGSRHHPGTTLADVMRLLPTPAASVVNDGEGLASWEARRARLLAKGYNGNGQGTPLTVAVAQLLPTPAAREHKGPGTGTAGRVRADGRVRTEADATLGLAIGALMPTPTAHDVRGARSPEQIAARKTTTGGPPRQLHETVVNELLPTPQAHDRHGPKTPEQQDAARARGIAGRGRAHGVSNLNETALRLASRSKEPAEPADEGTLFPLTDLLGEE